jgi:hypothetical protein
MSPKTARIVWYDKTEWSGEWRRFVAVLCFLVFYVDFVNGGTILGSAAQGARRVHSFAGTTQAWFGLIQFVSSIVVYLCGRSAWYGGRFARWWMALAAVTLLAVTAFDISIQEEFVFYGPRPSVPEKVFCYEQSLTRLPCLLAVVTGLWLSRWRAPWLGRRARAWVIVAVASLIGLSIAPSYALRIGLWGVFAYPYLGAVLLFFAGLSLISAGLLIAGRRIVRLGVLIVAGTDLYLLVLYTRQGLAVLIRNAILTLYFSVPLAQRPLRLPPAFRFGVAWLNREQFYWVCVDLVRDIGPWLLIAYYARRYPMRLPPDDGSPWPRRYCGNCGYNLHGLESQLCPECGRQLVE